MSTLPTPRPFTVALVYGTRPEAIKMAPLVRAFTNDPRFRPMVVVTGQHREMLDQVHRVFDITPDVDLDIHAPGHTLTEITTRSLNGIGAVLQANRPDAVLVQGDTTTTFSGALAAFYEQIPVIHTEAGLRTGDASSPFPEEINRRLATQLAELHLAPTWESRANLLRDNVAEERVHVTGNTVIDALLWTVEHPFPYGSPMLEARLGGDHPVILVTAHRRESLGAPMARIGRALARIAAAHPDHLIVFPMHRNPKVREAIMPQIEGLSNIITIEPLSYGGFCRLIARSSIILTDSGGVQEEGPALGKPVLVTRDNTERPEAVHSGTVRLIGTDEDAIVDAVDELITSPAAYARMSRAVNPYGDGHATARSLAAIDHHFLGAPRPADFVPGSTLAIAPERVFAMMSV